MKSGPHSDEHLSDTSDEGSSIYPEKGAECLTVMSPMNFQVAKLLEEAVCNSACEVKPPTQFAVCQRMVEQPDMQ